MKLLQEIIEQAWEDRSLLKEERTINAIREVVNLLDLGSLGISIISKVARARVTGSIVNS